MPVSPMPSAPPWRKSAARSTGCSTTSTAREAIGSATELARHRAISAGIEEATLETLDVDDTPLSYIPGNPIWVRVIGDLKI